MLCTSIIIFNKKETDPVVLEGLSTQMQIEILDLANGKILYVATAILLPRFCNKKAKRFEGLSEY